MQLDAMPTKTSSNHYRIYISTECKYPKTNTLEFWNVQYTTQPDLACFALDMLAIPAISVECVRVFSSAKHLLTDAHNCLNPDIIEANKCLKHWFSKPKEEKGDDKDLGLKEENGPKSEVSEEVEVLDIKKDYESDVEDGVIYEVDSDSKIVWKD
jgi:hypothetical protein